MFSFSEDYGFVNAEIRKKLSGGPTVIYHRHVEVILRSKNCLSLPDAKLLILFFILQDFKPVKNSLFNNSILVVTFFHM